MSIHEDSDNQELEMPDYEEDIGIPDIDLDLDEGEEATIDEDETE